MRWEYDTKVLKMEKQTYEQRMIVRYPLKLNKKTDRHILYKWYAVRNKSACLKYLLSKYLDDYLVNVQKVTKKELREADKKSGDDEELLDAYEEYMYFKKDDELWEPNR